jgi:hypothetical protein
MMDLLSVLQPQTPPQVANARTVHFDTTPPADRDKVEIAEEREDKVRLQKFRIERTLKALAGGHWATIGSITRRTGMHQPQQMIALRIMVQRKQLEHWQGAEGVSKWRLKTRSET